jgi:hypothetical protein
MEYFASPSGVDANSGKDITEPFRHIWRGLRGESPASRLSQAIS